MNVFDLQAKIGINTTEYKKGLSEASKEFSEVGGKIKDGAATMAKVSAAAFTAIAGAATATTAAVLKGVDAYTSYGDNIDKMSQKLGMSARAYQEWSAVMEHSGTSIDSMQASMKTLANAAETGNDAFERLGLSQENIANMSQEQLFSATIRALQNIDSETERTYLASQLLGRGATELGALLNTSAEDTEKMKQRVHELGGVMSDEAVKASAKYKDSIQDMKTAFVGMGRGLITDFVPALTEVSDGLTAIFSGEENGTERFLKGFDSAMTALSTSAGRIKPIVKKIGSIAVQVIPEIIGTVGEKMLDSIPSMLGAGRNLLANLAYGLENADFEGFGVFSNVFDSIFNNLPYYAQYAEMIISNLANKILDVDYGKLASNIGTIITTGINSITNLINDIDWEKVGENAADFVNNIPWGKIADLAIECLEAAIKNIPELAKSFFTNIDGDNLMDGIAVIASVKLLKGIKAAFSSNSECQTQFSGIGGVMNTKLSDLGKEGGASYATAFISVAGAAIAGWKAGTNIREDLEEKYGKETTYEKIGGAGWGVAKALVNKLTGASAGKKDEENSYTYTNQYGQKVTIKKYDMNGGYTDEYIKATTQGPRLPAYANGGRVTSPTIALVGEKEPETIIPDSKLRGMGGVHVEQVILNINGTFNANDPIERRQLAEEVSRELRNLEIVNSRAMGGAAW